MSETRKTATFVGVAAILLLAALLTTPQRSTPDAFLDQGEAFFPNFTDPNVATTLEVIDFDEDTATARPFQVTFRNGRWTIPSHHNYPADGEDRLARTAAGLIGIVKDDYRSDNVADHEALGVVGPLDEAATSLTGRGQRITLRDAGDNVLADMIVGNEVEGRSNLRFVRLPDQKRVYVSRMDLDLSTQFADWIEPDLLELTRNQVRQITLKDYSINERTGLLDNRDTLILDREGTGNDWTANQMAAGEEVDSTGTSDLLGAIDTLSIVGVRPKPEGLSDSLTQLADGLRITQSDLLSLQSRGYFFTGNGELVSNEGELEVRTDDGVVYILRFGEVVYGEGEAISAGTEASDDEDSGPAENRYLFVTATFDDTLLDPALPLPANSDYQDKEESEWSDEDRSNKDLQDAYDEWESQVEAGRERSEELNARFADWYYVISSDSFERVRLTRSDLVQREES
jgi:hypothetical protein